jgi:hypothetical protein
MEKKQKKNIFKNNMESIEEEVWEPSVKGKNPQ